MTQEELWPHPEADWLLSTYVSIANQVGAFASITLHVSGNIVAGDLIGWREYMSGVVDEELANANFSDPESKDGVLEALREPRRWLEAELLDDEDALAGPVGFIHLKNAFVYSGDRHMEAMSSPGVYWRGRLASVDGFSFGTPSAALESATNVD